MALQPGARLGRYEIIALLGSGGMGTVYRALDSMLGREIAIKVLPDGFAQHPERLARFAREARLLASLSHPNIAVVHGLDQVDDICYLQMELVRGETLAQRMTRGPLPLAESLPVFKQIAEALEAAHSQSIVHRDLKPANVMVTPQGLVKILDFGLAKVVAPEDSNASIPLPTVSSVPTQAGLVMGTAAYMSPEQARGDAVDRRTDIWAFGCVLYEALTGFRAFQGRTPSDIIASVLREDPDWARLPGSCPARLRHLVRRCLQKDPHSRLHDIADARIEFDEALRDPLASQSGSVASATFERVEPPAWWRRRGWIGASAAGLLLAIGLGAIGARWLRPVESPPTPVVRLTLTMPAGQVLERGRFPPIAVSPDGQRLVYAASVRGERTRLYVRRLDELETRPVPATEGAITPFFSPDGQWLGFYADGALKKVSLAGGVPLTIGEAPPVWSASWGRDRIVFATTLGQTGLWSVPVDGGAPVEITTLGPGESQHGYPQILEDGVRVLFSVMGEAGWRPALHSLTDGRWRIIGDGRTVGEGARYLPTGHLVSMQSAGLVAVPFDPVSGRLAENPIPLLERLETSRFGGAYFAVAAGTGSLVYLPPASNAVSRQLLRVGRDGRSAPVLDARLGYEHPSLAPGGRHVAVTIASEAGSDIWIIDLERGTRTRFTTGESSAFPVWSADGSRLAYQSAAPGLWNLYWRPIDQSAGAQPLFGEAASAASAGSISAAGLLPGTLPTLSGANPQFPMSWASGATGLAFHERKSNGERDIWIVSPGGDPTPFLLTPFDERTPRFSPDGRWLAYVSDESGRDEVYVQPFPGPGPKYLISTDGGVDPVWSRNGRELFYRQDDQMMAVSLVTTSTIAASRPSRLFDTRVEATDDAPSYDVSPDGQWFLMTGSERGAGPAELHVVLNWLSEVTARAPLSR